MKQNWEFFQAVSVSVLLYGHNKMPGEKARRELHKNATYCSEQILKAAAYKTAAVQPLTSHLTR